MSRRANWSFRRPASSNRAPPPEVPDYVQAAIRSALSNFCEDRIDDFLYNVPRLIATYRHCAAYAARVPSKANKVAAAQKLSEEAEAFASKLLSCGGAGDAIDTVMVQRRDYVDRNRLIADLLALSSAAATAAHEIDKGTSTAEKARIHKPREALAAAVAEAYMACFHERPASTVSRDTAANHPFTSVLKILIEHCTGRWLSDQAVEPIARAGIAFWGQVPAAFDRNGPHRV